MEIPRVGQLIRYSYLWLEQHRRGTEEGLKDRPCLVVIATASEDGEPILFVAPVTHSEQPLEALAVELPLATKQRLKLDEERSWIVTNEVNKFTWPGPDVRPDAEGEVIIGFVPAKLEWFSVRWNHLTTEKNGISSSNGVTQWRSRTILSNPSARC
jgi:hypothetical protein